MNIQHGTSNEKQIQMNKTKSYKLPLSNGLKVRMRGQIIRIWFFGFVWNLYEGISG